MQKKLNYEPIPLTLVAHDGGTFLGAPILQEVMGSQYGRTGQATMNAGSLVAEVIRYAGCEKSGEGPLPAACIAKTAAMWKPKQALR